MSTVTSTATKKLPPVDFGTFIDWVENYLLRTAGRHYKGDCREFVEHVLHVHHALYRGDVDMLESKLTELSHPRIYAEVGDDSTLDIRTVC